jgi:hypothetical protein
MKGKKALEVLIFIDCVEDKIYNIHVVDFLGLIFDVRACSTKVLV